MTYVGEEAVDLGGPRREFWELMVKKGVDEYCIGGDKGVTVIPNAAALQVCIIMMQVKFNDVVFILIM